MKTPTLIDEREVLEGLREGDRLAFNKIYAHYNVFVFGNILKTVRDVDVAKDLVQDVFVKIWERRTKINLNKSFPAFLFTCAKNQVYNYLKRVAIEKQVTSYLTFQNTELYSHVDEAINFKETDSLYQNILSKLPPQCRKVYKLCREEGLSYEETGIELGISKDTVRNHLAKATRIIKEQMIANTISLIIGGFIITHFILSVSQ